MQNVPILNDHVDMRPILNGNLCIHSIHLKPKKDPFPSKLCSHIPSKMDPSQTPGEMDVEHNICYTSKELKQLAFRLEMLATLALHLALHPRRQNYSIEAFLCKISQEVCALGLL